MLMHERSVRGGNASSEIRMWICGSKGENNRETGILEEIELFHVTDNRKRAYDLSVSGEFEGLTLIPISLWGDGDKIAVVSFDFL